MTNPETAKPSKTQAQYNVRFIIAILLLSPILGSVASVLVIAAAVLGCVHILSGIRTYAPPAPIFWSGAAFAAFFLAEALSGLVNWNGQATLVEIGENFIFLGLMPFHALLVRRRDTLLREVLAAAPWCAIAALVLALLQQFAIGYRPQGGAGNAAVFAVTVALLLSFNVANALTARKPVLAVPALAGVLAASATLILSQTRALWPCLVVFPAVLWLATRKGRTSRHATKIVAVLAAAMVIILLALGGTIRDRVNQAIVDVGELDNGQYSSSIGKRVVIWKVAVAAIGERPLVGHGPDAPRRLMEERSSAVGGQAVVYSHFHNFLLNEMVRAGVIGTLALIAMFVVPLFAAAFARRDATATLGFGLLICIQIAFLLSGSVGIMLDHDIVDTQFLAGTAFGLYLVFGRSDESHAVISKKSGKTA